MTPVKPSSKNPSERARDRTLVTCVVREHANRWPTGSLIQVCEATVRSELMLFIYVLVERGETPPHYAVELACKVKPPYNIISGARGKVMFHVELSFMSNGG